MRTGRSTTKLSTRKLAPAELVPRRSRVPPLEIGGELQLGGDRGAPGVRGEQVLEPDEAVLRLAGDRVVEREQRLGEVPDHRGDLVDALGHHAVAHPVEHLRGDRLLLREELRDERVARLGVAGELQHRHRRAPASAPPRT